MPHVRSIPWVCRSYGGWAATKGEISVSIAVSNEKGIARPRCYVRRNEADSYLRYLGSQSQGRFRPAFGSSSNARDALRRARIMPLIHNIPLKLNMILWHNTAPVLFYYRRQAPRIPLLEFKGNGNYRGRRWSARNFGRSCRKRKLW